jgi:2-amino-4-hydroxy-6-hydroxymethyldihydropteridine diphosphokinase
MIKNSDLTLSFVEKHTAFVALGSNLGDKRSFCLHAIEILDELDGVTVERRSSLYRSEPVGPQDQDWFVNAVIQIQTSLSPHELLAALHLVEFQLQRKRERRWGPRTIDLDLLFYDQMIQKDDLIQIPHPEMENRHFVLLPFAEIAPRWQHPVLKQSILTLLRNLSPKSKCTPLVASEIEKVPTTHLNPLQKIIPIPS